MEVVDWFWSMVYTQKQNEIQESHNPKHIEAKRITGNQKYAQPISNSQALYTPITDTISYGLYKINNNIQTWNSKLKQQPLEMKTKTYYLLKGALPKSETIQKGSNNLIRVCLLFENISVEGWFCSLLGWWNSW